jgi:hypothetical protein
MRRYFLLPLLAFLAIATPAQADVTASTITAPTGPHYAISYGSATLDIAGRTTGVGNVDIVCITNETTSYLAHDVHVAGDGTFSLADVDIQGLIEPSDYAYGTTCTLRALPADTTPADLGNFRGPLLALSRYGEIIENGHRGDFTLWAAGTDRGTWVQSFGGCGADSYLLDPVSLHASYDGFRCTGTPVDAPNLDQPFTGVKVDGAPAYSPGQASGSIGGYGAGGTPGAPFLSVLPVQFDEDTGAVAVTERDGFAKCGPDASYPPTQFSCTTFESVPVQLQRTTSVLAGSQIVRVVDHWTSTDHQAHDLDLALQIGVCCSSHETFRFPGETGFGRHDTNDATPETDKVDGPFGAGKPIFARDAGGAGAGMFVLPLQSADSARFTLQDTFALQYRRTIPASGELTFTHYYVTTRTVGELDAEAAKLIASLPKPVTPPAPPHGGSGPVITPPKPQFSRHGKLKLRRVGRTFRVTTRDRVVCACTVHVTGRWVVPTDVKASLGRTNVVRFRLTRGGARKLRRAGHLHVRYVLAAPGVTKTRTVRLRTGTS